MLEIAAILPPGALIGGDERLLAEAVLRTGGARFVAREGDIVRTDGRITGWREQHGAVEAVTAGPNSGNSRFQAGPPAGVVCQEGMNCGFTLPGFAPEVEAFTVAVVYWSEGEAKTLASVSTGQANNMIFLAEAEGRVLAKDRAGAMEVSLPVNRGAGAKLALLGYDGRSLRLGLGDRRAEVSGTIPGMAHPADFFIGCRSNRAGLAKTLGQSLLHEVMFWPDRCLPGSSDPEDMAALATLNAHVRWTY
ncbi:hypothetical protein [Rhodobacter sp. SY28-1]|uniref:hypothetical protein n=1 Tax=Rhodobacter sp. SY28-1 TaxID=2562317 RepID=UPI0010C14209|nr:hypothetical protein [Rhodobacter sp. SY28-1]